MKIALIAVTVLSMTAITAVANAIEPIPGSITYGGQPDQKLTKSPIGAFAA